MKPGTVKTDIRADRNNQKIDSKALWRPSATTSICFTEEDRRCFDEASHEMMLASLEAGGREAFSAPKIEAARHEAGHCVVDTALVGDKVVLASIFRLADFERQMSNALGVAIELWGGGVRGTFAWRIGPDSDPVEDLRTAARMLGGWVGEWFDDRTRMRPGSSIDEIVLGQMIVNGAALKLRADPEVLLNDLIGVIVDVLYANRAAHEAITARLMRKSTIGPDALKRLLKDVHAPASMNDAEPRSAAITLAQDTQCA